VEKEMAMKANWILCLAAGIIGGAVSHFALVRPVHAQVFAVPQELRTQQVVLVDERDKTFATLAVTERDGREVFEIIGKDGQVIAQAGEGARIIQ
jgi:hypothetical protein